MNKRNSSQQGLAPLLLIIGIVILVVLGLIATTFFIAYNSPQVQNTIKVDQSLQKQQQAVSSVAKPYWDKEQELFRQIKTKGNTPERAKQVEDAIGQLNQAIQVEPNNPKIWFELCQVNSWIRDVGDNATKTLNACKKAEELDTTNVVYINQVGDELSIQKKYDEAILEYQKTIRLTSKSGYAYKGLGDAYTGLKIYDKAKESYQKAVDTFTS